MNSMETFFTAIARAQDNIILENPLGQGTTFIDLLNNIFTKMLVFVGAIVTVMILIGAFQMMFASGNPEKFAKGQKTILYAVIGFIIALIAKGIVAIVQSLLKV